VSDKPKKRITGESVEIADRWVKEHAAGWKGYVVDDLAGLIAEAHREGWDAAILAAMKDGSETALVVRPTLDHHPECCYQVAVGMVRRIRALPYPGIAKAEGGSDGE
jgi:hypothetical protein